MIDSTDLQVFFEDRLKREDDIKELRDEAKEALESFCSATLAGKKAVNMAYKLFKALQSDKSSAEATQFEYDKLAELLIGTSTN